MQPEILIGMGGWSLPSFDGPFYPENQGKGFRKLEYYSRFFDLVEVNATFYTTSLGPQQARRWLQDIQDNERFTFTVKLFQGFTHKLNATQGDVKAVRALLEPLVEAGKLGGLILQFPHSFERTPGHEQYLRKLAESFSSCALFVEFRHDSWNSAEAFDVMKSCSMQLVNTDLPAIKQHIPFTNEAWGDAAYYRLMGRNKESWDRGGVEQRYNYFYSEEELREILRNISNLKATVRKAFVVFHNDPNAHSPVNGFQLRHMIDPNARFPAPAVLTQSFPQLQAFCGKPEEPNSTGRPRLIHRVTESERRRKNT
ncbi:MAG: DUF72 domain-containing protein [Ignavibacteriales bacterium]|nr:DUF72 domain-containing protein [Ignavibacteriales bacterium]